jgi:sulfur relay (sulfurtransferase) complex TusBCD TusD component (DsrE family)
MYTATILNKELVNGGLQVTIQFSDGVTTVNESVKPADFDNLKAWVASRLSVLNASKDIDTNHPN